jgi:hypothetical protein
MTQTKELKRVLARFLANLGHDPHGPGVHVLENPTEELQHELSRGKKSRLFGMAANAAPVVGRVEENYLYYTRRFPSNTANNTIGGGAVTAGDYLYFTNGLGDQGSAAGYFSVAQLTLQQTNMASGGKIPTGRGFRMFDLGVTFNAQVAPADIVQLMDSMNMRFEKQSSQLVLQHGPIKFWPGGMGPYGFAATAVGGSPLTISAATNGMPALTNVRRYRNPRILSANEQFQYVINAAAATPQANTTVALSNFVEVTIFLFGQVLDAIPN